MKCQEIESRLMEYMDGTLARAERTAIDLHAQSCSMCSERIRGFTQVSTLLESWQPIAVSPAFNAQLQRRLREEAAAPFWNRWWSSLIPRLTALPLGSPVFAMALLIMVSVAAVVLKYSPAEPQTLARQQTPFVETVDDSGVEDINLYRNLPMLEDMDVLGNFEVLQVLSENKQ